MTIEDCLFWLMWWFNVCFLGRGDDPQHLQDFDLRESKSIEETRNPFPVPPHILKDLPRINGLAKPSFAVPAGLESLKFETSHDEELYTSMLLKKEEDLMEREPKYYLNKKLQAILDKVTKMPLKTEIFKTRLTRN